MGMPRLVLCVCTYIALFFLGQGLDWIGVFVLLGSTHAFFLGGMIKRFYKHRYFEVSVALLALFLDGRWTKRGIGCWGGYGHSIHSPPLYCSILHTHSLTLGFQLGV